jgi:hypothetical protein
VPQRATVEEVNMPGSPLSAVRFPAIHLPEMTRDDIARAVEDARRDIRLPDVDLSGIDVPRSLAAAAESAGFITVQRRPGRPLIIAVAIALALIVFAVLASPAVRPKLAEAGRRARTRIDDARAEASSSAAVESIEGEAAEMAQAVDAVGESRVATPVGSDAPSTNGSLETDEAVEAITA